MAATLTSGLVRGSGYASRSSFYFGVRPAVNDIRGHVVRFSTPFPLVRGIALSALLVKVDKVAALLDVSEGTIWNWHGAERMPAPLKMGRNTLWRVRELEDWVAAGMPARKDWRWAGEVTPLTSTGRKVVKK